MRLLQTKLLSDYLPMSNNIPSSIANQNLNYRLKLLEKTQKLPHEDKSEDQYNDEQYIYQDNKTSKLRQINRQKIKRKQKVTINSTFRLKLDLAIRKLKQKISKDDNSNGEQQQNSNLTDDLDFSEQSLQQDDSRSKQRSSKSFRLDSDNQISCQKMSGTEPAQSIDRELERMQSQSWKLIVLEKTYPKLSEIINKKRQAIQQYINILNFEHKGFRTEEHDKIKGYLSETIFTQISKCKEVEVTSSQIKIVSKRIRNKRTFKLNGMSKIKKTEQKQSTNSNLENVTTRKMARCLAESNSQEIRLMELKSKLKKDNGRSKEKGCKRKNKAIHKVTRARKSTLLVKSKSKIKAFDRTILSKLPTRKPNIKHQYNSMSSKQIKYFGELIRGDLYYASNLLKYKSGKFVTNPRLQFSQFIDESVKSTLSCRALAIPLDSQTKKIKLKRNFQYTNKKILILDLDQTLVHSQGLNEKPNKQMFPFSFDFEDFTRHYAVRNYVSQFLENMSQKYYVVVFTSAAKGYADKIIESIDPAERYIHHRLYRNNCYLHSQAHPYIKDLRILNRDLSQVIIVDNSLYAYWFQVDNGVPIIPFVGVQDWELKKLEKYLMKLEKVDDVREVNRRIFHMHLYQELNNSQTITQKYCQMMNEEISRKNYEQ